ncbi:hypothetical protein FGSG_12777 [Fusarium graminearum PH-1]|uniref:Chromosome 3, complete genome n=1 Tax=Gibberella zeae (strain ATCC MYA-4620 / CBS 123657 / FGSC 9075 / NRRL 31084 / PH-1) TaxID=229533 RepID=I1S7F4_GIBZE|nr:hypothetical protein FGSG_12777 [Fusarium graminearum PH-1]ESU11649.1 hypothetical protein FGSG_12777 [Fusarium graminearum PH-1]CEF87454.1 unnamed protein product [Fusarium graminearum]|eukprot:XP_011324225.1 hypothetical protein FGSG_12777 [Fusarium graminearum PH-1]
MHSGSTDRAKTGQERSPTDMGFLLSHQFPSLSPHFSRLFNFSADYLRSAHFDQGLWPQLVQPTNRLSTCVAREHDPPPALQISHLVPYCTLKDLLIPCLLKLLLGVLGPVGYQSFTRQRNILGASIAEPYLSLYGISSYAVYSSPMLDLVLFMLYDQVMSHFLAWFKATTILFCQTDKSHSVLIRTSTALQNHYTPERLEARLFVADRTTSQQPQPNRQLAATWLHNASENNVRERE